MAPLFLLLPLCCGPVVKHPAVISPPQNLLYPQETDSLSKGSYRIQPGDLLDVKFFYNPELNEPQLARATRRPCLTPAHRGGARRGAHPAELRAMLKKRYEEGVLKLAEVAVIVRTANGQKVFVDGEVFKPGLINIVGSLTTLQAIAQAGGAKLESARLNEVIIIRRGPDNRPVTTTVNLQDAITGTAPEQDIPLMPYDIVYIPKSPIGAVDLWVDQYIRRLLPFPLPYVVPPPSY